MYFNYASFLVEFSLQRLGNLTMFCWVNKILSLKEPVRTLQPQSKFHLKRKHCLQNIADTFYIDISEDRIMQAILHVISFYIMSGQEGKYFILQLIHGLICPKVRTYMK